ncbi:MAG: AraC family transcriptional regulator [Spirochaetaceae bacterium]|nr:MAG: AraC family transcriptional regulator [Spirochaetaceae bacterium]
MRYIYEENDSSAQWLERITPALRIAGADPGHTHWLDPRRVIYDHELMLMGAGGRYAYEFVDPDGSTTAHECTGPCFIIIPPGLWHTCRGIESDKVRRAWLHFDWVPAPDQRGTPVLTYWPARPRVDRYRLAPPFVPGRTLAGPIANESIAFDIHARATDRFNHGTPRMRATAKGLLLELLLYLLWTSTPEDRTRDNALGGAGAIRAALDEVSLMPFSRSESIRERLRRLGRSYDHQARLFRRAYGVTPLQYVTARRIERAKNLLRDSDESIASIGRAMGFADVVYFNRLFRRVTGVTPGSYRRSFDADAPSIQTPR